MNDAYWRYELVTKGEIFDIISSEPLGYSTEDERKKLSGFADRICNRIAAIKPKSGFKLTCHED